MTNTQAIDPANAQRLHAIQALLNAGDQPGALRLARDLCGDFPGVLWFEAVEAAVRARAAAGWEADLARLIDLHEDNPGDTGISDLLAEAYLAHARRDWTEVEAEVGGSTLVKGAQSILRLVSGTHVEPGLYPTTALHVATAATCLDRARAAGPVDPGALAGVVDLEAIVGEARRRHFRATWGEIGLSVLLLAGFFMFAGQSLLLALAYLGFGGAMLLASFEPQYRSNRILLSRRGKTLGDSIIGLAASHRYGGFAYLAVVIMFFPVVAGYRLYMNWGQGWLARPAIAAVTGRRGREAAQSPAGAAASSFVTDLRDRVRRFDLPSGFARLSGLSPRVWAAIAVGVLALGSLTAWLTLRPDASPAGAAMAGTPSSRDVPMSSPPPSAAAPPTLSGIPTVINTGLLEIAGTRVRLYGVTGEGGIPARQMESFIQEQGGEVTCEPLSNGAHRCRTSQGYDIAAAAIVNGAARASADAPADYREMQGQAQAASKGIWR